MEPTPIKPLADGTWVLELDGTFLPDWVGTFCTHLSLRRIHVQSGFARQVQCGQWQSRFVLRPLDASVRMDQHNYRALAVAPKMPGLAPRVRINSFDLDDRGDALEVSVRAPDALGFLGHLLGSFSRQMLFVHEMKIDSAGDETQDHFVLKGLAGMAPGPDIAARLNAALQGMVG